VFKSIDELRHRKVKDDQKVLMEQRNCKIEELKED
jgi:hypothetical protein